MAEFDPIILAIKTEVDKTKADLDAVTARLKEMGETSKKQTNPIGDLTGHLKGLASGFIGLIGAHEAVDFLKESGKAAVEDAKSSAILEQQLKNTVGATKEQSAAVEESIRSMSNQYGVLDDKIRPAYANLIRVTKDTGEATKLTDLAMNVAAGTGKDLTAVSQALAKAHEGQMGALTRLLPSVKGMKDPMAELTKQFAGAAETAANNDPYQRLQVAMDHIKESVGTALLPVLKDLASWLTSIAPIVEKFFADIKNPATDAGKKFKEMQNAAKNVIDFFKDNLEIIKNVGLTILGVVAAIKIYGAVVNAITIVQNIWKAATVAWTVVTKIATAAQAAFNLELILNPIGAVIALIVAITAALIYFFTQTNEGKKAWAGFMVFLQDTMKNIGKIFSEISKAAIRDWNTVLKWFQDLPKNIQSFFADAGKWLSDVGKNIVAGLWKGLQDAWNGLVAGFNALVNLLPDAIKKILGIKSPSTVFHEIGTNIGQGLANGLYASTPWVETAMTKMSAKVVGSAENMLNQVMDLQSQAIAIAGGDGTMAALVYGYQQTGLGAQSSLVAAQNAMANQTFVDGMDVTALIAQAQAAANSSTGGYQLYVNPTTGAVSRVQGGGISASDLNSMGLGASSGFVQVNLTAQTNATVASITQAVVDGIKYNAITGSALGGSI